MSEHHDDFAFEPVRGLPQLLPRGERMIWQGAPRWQDLAVHAFHARKVVWYFIGLSLIAVATRFAEGQTAVEATKPFEWLVPMGLAAAALLVGLAYLSARTTVYTITSKRIVMRIGMAVSVTLNLPFSQIDGASLRRFANGSGDIPLRVTPKERVAYMLLWPHARPFRFAHPEPCLRSVPDAEHVASLLAAALTGTAPVPVRQEKPASTPVSGGQPVAA